jgi:hypothetical protein
MDFEFPRKKTHLFIELMRQLSGAQRVWVSRKMTAWEVSRSRQEIAGENPNFNEEEVKLKWVELTYGEELAARLREHLRRDRPAAC